MRLPVARRQRKPAYLFGQVTRIEQESEGLRIELLIVVAIIGIIAAIAIPNLRHRAAPPTKVQPTVPAHLAVLGRLISQPSAMAITERLRPRVTRPSSTASR
jgi:hypothetical protein